MATVCCGLINHRMSAARIEVGLDHLFLLLPLLLLFLIILKVAFLLTGETSGGNERGGESKDSLVLGRQASILSIVFKCYCGYPCCISQ